MSKRQERFFKDKALPFAEGRYTRQSSETFKPHLHQAFCIGAVESGEISYRVGDQEALLAPGSLALINPETTHACNPAEGGVRSFYMLYLDRDWCLEVQQSLWQNNTFIPVDCIMLRDITLYRYYLDTMEVLMARDHLMEKEQRLAMLAETVFARCCHPAVPDIRPPEHVAELKEWLGRDLQRDDTLTSFAAEHGINPYTLLRHFRNSVGITPHAYRMNYRIEQARKLLQKGCDIADTAQLCGFFDQSHMHRHFKAMTSVTPKQYRDQFRRKEEMQEAARYHGP